MIAILITLIITIPISIAWAIGIDKNKDYKGEEYDTKTTLQNRNT